MTVAGKGTIMTLQVFATIAALAALVLRDEILADVASIRKCCWNREVFITNGSRLRIKKMERVRQEKV